MMDPQFGHSRHLRTRFRHWLRYALLIVVPLSVGVVGGGAWAYWTATSTLGSSGAAGATSVNAGTIPVASGTGSALYVSWAASTLATGQAVSGYQVNRYDTATLTRQTVLAGCAGTITARNCTEVTVPTGSWKYTITPVYSTNWFGVESAKSAIAVTDATGPVNVLSLSSITGGAVLTGNTLYYRGASSGSFALTNVLSDAGTGPASSQTVALTGTSTGWSHSPSTVSAPTGGPYVSNPFSWASNTSSSPSESITGRDVVGNPTATQLNFSNDSTPPAGGAIGYTNGYTSSRSVTITFSVGSDAGAGVDSSSGVLTRASAPLANGVCGTYSAFATVIANPTSPYSDTSVTNGTCFAYQYVVADRIGNLATYSSANVAKVNYGNVVNSTPGLVSLWRMGESPLGSDAFTGAAGVALTTHTAVDGTQWSSRAADAGVAVLTGAGAVRGSTAGGLADYDSAPPVSSDYMVEADVVLKTTISGDTVGVVGRLDPSATGNGTFYSARYENTTSPGHWAIYSTVNGSTPTLVGSTYAQSLTAGQKYRLGLKLTGSTISLLVDRIARVTATDTSISAGGRAGIMLKSGVTVGSNTTGLQLDNYNVSPLAKDSKGSNDGNYFNGVQLGTPGALLGDSNSAATFDGVDSFLQSPTTTGLPTGQSARSVEVWFKTTGAAAGMLRQTLFNYGSFIPANEFAAWLDPNGTQINSPAGSPTGGDKIFTFANNFNDNQWHHFVETYDGTTLRMYLDGISPAGITVVRNTVVDQFGFSGGAVMDPTIGNAATFSYFNGSLDELAFYNTVLSPATISAHFGLGDNRGPQGGSVSVAGVMGTNLRYSTSTNLSVSTASGIDGSGIASGARLERATASLTSVDGLVDGICGSFGTYIQIGTLDQSSPVTDTVGDGMCYSYEYVVSDSLGNSTTYSSAYVKVDATPPALPTVTLSNLTNAFASGPIVYYRPSAVSGGFTVSVGAADPSSGIASYSIPILGSGWTSTQVSPAVMTYAWAAANPSAPGNQPISVTNNAGVMSPNLGFAVTPDNDPPVVGTITYPDGAVSGKSLAISFTDATDAGSGIASSFLQRSWATLSGSTCGTMSAFATVVTNATSPYVDTIAAGRCYQYRYLTTDNVGNTSSATSSNVVRTSSYQSEILGTAGLVSYYQLSETPISSDSFTDSTGITLTSHYGESSANWTRRANDTLSATITASDTVRKQNANGGVAYYTSAIPGSANYRVSADVVVKSLINLDKVGVDARVDPTSTIGTGTYYSARYDTSVGGWQLYSTVDNVGTLLGTYSQTLTAGQTYRLGLDVNGSTVRILVDDVERISVSNAAIASAGRAGIELGSSNATAPQSDTTGLQLDNFQVTPSSGLAVSDAVGPNSGDYAGGVLLGAPGMITGNPNTSALFDGVNDSATVPRSISTDFSIEFWFKSTQSLGTTCTQWWSGARLVDADIRGNSNDFGTGLCGGKVLAGVGSNPGGDVSVISASSYNDGGWHQVVMTRSQTTKIFQLYVDGALAGSATGLSTNALSSSTVINFGAAAPPDISYFSGALDEIALYSLVLSPATITSHYNLGH